MYDVAIIGAGITGSMVARELGRYQISVCVLEKENDAAAGASRANSGIVHAGFDAMPGSMKAWLNVKGAELMEQTASELGVKYKQNGSLVVGYDEKDRELIDRLYRQGVKNGVKNLEILSRGVLRQMEPRLTKRAQCALYAPTGAIICPYELTLAALGNAMENGAVFLRCFEVSAIEQGSPFQIYAKDGRRVESHFLVNAAGVHADRIAVMLGDNSFSIQPRKGEYLLLDKECGTLVSHTIFRTPTDRGKGILISPTVDGNLLLGPTAHDQKSREDTTTTAAGLEQIIGQTLDALQQVPLRQVITSFAGLRARGNSGDFIIRPYGERTVQAAAIDSPGLSASPAVAQYIVELLREMGLKLIPKREHQPFRRPLYWFRDLTLTEKDAYIQDHPDYGKIVCRCETISQGEILEALNREPKAVDLDGVKRRTRSGMGRCQGGFCSPRIIELIAGHLGVPFCSVTKSGGGSFINAGKTKGDEEV